MTVDDANRLVAAAEDSGVFFTGYEVQHRLTERSRHLKQILRDGTIGEPMTLYHVAHGGLPQPWAGQQGDSWWLHRDKAPGGAWIDHAIYAVDQIRWVFEQEVESVSAVGDVRRHQHLQNMEDWGLAWMRLKNGFTAIMEDTWTADSGTHFNRYIGTDGSLILESDHFLLHKKGSTERIEIPEQSRRPMSIVASAIEGRERLPFDHTDSVRNLAACLAAYESACTGKQVKL
jgi:predicted dehydrogenase